jgi:hypothetical protein
VSKGEARTRGVGRRGLGAGVFESVSESVFEFVFEGGSGWAWSGLVVGGLVGGGRARVLRCGAGSNFDGPAARRGDVQV